MRIGAIDVGTNSIHLLVAEVSPDGRVTVIEKARDQAELGAGEFASHRLTPEAIDRGVSTLSRFKQACDSYGVEDIHAAATSAVREASNGEEFCRRVKDETGIHVRVISGTDEARLVYLGARGDVDFSRGRALLFDLGGGSTEFVLCDAEQPLVTESLPLGHIRLAEAFLRSDPISETDRRALKAHILQQIQPLLSRIRSDDFRTLVGTSGTVRTLARIATLQRGDPPPAHEHGLVLRRSELEDLIRTFRAKPSSQWILAPGMDEKRRRTLPAGAILVREVMKALGKDEVLTSERSLRDGLLVDWILRHRPELDLSGSVPDPRRRSVLAALAKYGGDRRHVDRVSGFALTIFDGTVASHRLSIDDRRLLEFGSLLHDIGHHIDGADHHRHGQYLIRHTPMPGFTAPEIALLGALVRYHRGSKPKARSPEFASFSPTDRKKIRVLSAILRVADALDRGHDQNVTSLRVEPSAEREPGRIALRASTREPGDLEQWAVVQRLGYLQDALGVPVEVEVSRDKTSLSGGGIAPGAPLR